MPRTSKEVKEALGTPQINRLKALGSGMRVGKVIGERVLIKTVIPFTDIDRVQLEGKLYIPDHIKKDNTPLPSTGIIIALGEDLVIRNLVFKVGTAVMFSKFAGADFIIDEEDFKILDVNEILCTIEFTEDSPVVPVKKD